MNSSNHNHTTTTDAIDKASHRSKILNNKKEHSIECKQETNISKSLHLIGHEWGNNTDTESKKLIKELESFVLKRVNAKKDGFKQNEWYIYIDVNDSDQDKVWINRCKYNYKPKSIMSGKQTVGYFNFFFEGQNWQIQFINKIVQLFVFDPIIFTEKYQSIVDPDNINLALERYKTKEKEKQRKIQEKEEEKLKQKEEYELNLRRKEYFETAAKIEKIKKDNYTELILNKVTKRGTKRKRNQMFSADIGDEIFNQIAVHSRIARRITMDEDTIQNEICFYSEHCYYDRQRHKNMPLIMDSTPNKRRKISSISNNDQDDDYDLNDWWNVECGSKLKTQQHYDPGVCLPTLNDKYKKTCYPPPPVYDSFTKCTGSAAFPYIVRETMTMISDAMFLKKSLIYLWDKEFEVDFMKKLNAEQHKKGKEMYRDHREMRDDNNGSISYDYYLEEPQIVSASDYDNNSVITDIHPPSVSSSNHSFNILYHDLHCNYQSSLSRYTETDTETDNHSFNHLFSDKATISTLNTSKCYKLHQLIHINGKCDDELKEWCMDDLIADAEDDLDFDLFDINSEFDSIFNDIHMNEREEEEEEEILNIDSKYKDVVFKITEMYLGDKHNDDSPRKYLKMDHADDAQRDALHFMNFKQDVLNGKQMGDLNISTCSARCVWHHDFGLCTWYQVIYGENNIKIWDVEATKMIEECKYNKELTEAKKDYYISSIQPTWEIFLRPGVVLYLPSGSGYLITTTSDVAVMITGCFLPQTHIRIGYEMVRYHDTKQSVDWDTIIIRETANVFNVNDKQLFIDNDNSNNCNIRNDEYISIPKRLSYLDKYSKQQNWNIDYKKKHRKHCNNSNSNDDDVESVTFD